MKTARALTAALALIVAQPAWAQSSPPKRDCGALPTSFSGPLFTGDGDTIYSTGVRPGIRLWGMNAPELRDGQKAETVPGMRARALVDDLLAASKHQGTCEPIEWDHYCRIVARCTTAAGVDLTLATLQAGLAYGFYLSKHPDRLPQAMTYADAEAEARQARRGLWPQWLGER
jgi:endonuclease YncB( thermonuclease family)